VGILVIFFIYLHNTVLMYPTTIQIQQLEQTKFIHHKTYRCCTAFTWT